MKIKSVEIKGFRGYSSKIILNVDDLTVLIGKNDAGKSSVLNALDLFFNGPAACSKLGKDDINKQNSKNGDKEIEISVEFCELPEEALFDSTAKTSLKEEYLLTENNTLCIVKKFINGDAAAKTVKTYIRAFHPNAACCSGLFLKSNTQLKQHIDDLCITNVDKRNNPDMRKAIWGACGDALERSLIDIDIGVSESRDIWSKITPIMPSFALFQADRKNSDKDIEVQDPFIYAIREIMKKPSIQESLSTVADEVRGALSVVTDATSKKLEDLNPDLVEALDACIPENSLLKWSDVFKAVSIESDTAVPLNKRGSGIRRLILLSFFQAEAERRRAAVAIPSIVYAIEEPEISQHPDHQRALVESLIALSLTSNTQILLTTHSPEIVKKLEFKNIRLISKELPIIRGVKSKELPYPSLNEINYLAFDKVTLDYHNELYSFIEYHNLLSEFIVEKPTRNYIKKTREREVVTAINLSQYIRHQIHHPENDFNKRFSIDELQTSVGEMRAFIIAQREGRARET